MPKRKKSPSSAAQTKRRKTLTTALIERPNPANHPDNTFFGLPTELRLAIFSYVFHEKPKRNGDLQILLTCRQIYHEAYASAYRHMVLVIPSHSFHNQHRDWLGSLRRLSPHLRSSLRTIQFWRCGDLDTILRAGVFRPDRLIDVGFGIPSVDVTSSIWRVLYDYACKLSSSRSDYILPYISVPTPGLKRDRLERIRGTFVSNDDWKKKLTRGIMKRYEDIEVGEVSERGDHVSFRVAATRLDGSQFRLVVSNNRLSGL